MGGSVSVPLDKHVVIVGGGYAGTKLAMYLKAHDANFTLIDVKDSFVHSVANVRAVVEPDITPTMYIDYATTFGGIFRQGRVCSINTKEQEVVLEGDAGKVSYDVLVLATGCLASFPTKTWDSNKDKATEMFKEYAAKVKESQRIAIVGGGPVGVEIAAEIRTDFPNKEVTLFHPNEDLLRTGLRQKTQQTLRNILKRMDVKLRTGEKITNLDELGDTGPFTLKSSGGEELDADLVISCIGMKVNSTAYLQGLGESMDDKGALVVNEFLQVKGHDNVFAMGDCTNVKEMKLVLTAEAQAECVAHNLNAMMRGTKLKAYKPDNIPIKIVISLGRNSGIGELRMGGIILPEFVVARLKSGHMFIPKMWAGMKQSLSSSTSKQALSEPSTT